MFVVFSFFVIQLFILLLHCLLFIIEIDVYFLQLMRQTTYDLFIFLLGFIIFLKRFRMLCHRMKLQMNQFENLDLNQYQSFLMLYQESLTFLFILLYHDLKVWSFIKLNLLFRFLLVLNYLYFFLVILFHLKLDFLILIFINFNYRFMFRYFNMIKLINFIMLYRKIYNLHLILLYFSIILLYRLSNQS